MNKIVWVMGQSAAGKWTFINYALANPESELMQKLGLSGKNIIPAADNMYHEGFLSTESETDRAKIVDYVRSKLEGESNAAVLVKWQYTDNEQHCDTITKMMDAFPEIKIGIILLSVDGDILYARLPNKWWWNEKTANTREQMDDVVQVLRDNVVRWQGCGFGFEFIAEIDSTDGYKIIENSELKLKAERIE